MPRTTSGTMGIRTYPKIVAGFVFISLTSMMDVRANDDGQSIHSTTVFSLSDAADETAEASRLATTFLALPEVPPATAGPPKRALLVGISKYARGRGAPADWSDLPTQDDIEVMRQVLLRKFGFKDEDIQVLTEAQVTKTAIETAFREHLIGPAQPGDVVLFYFSGHGQLVPDSTAWGGTRPALVTSDYIDQNARNGYRTHLRSDHIRELLRELKTRMSKGGSVVGNITVLLDSCHSGGGTKNEMMSKGRSWDDAIDGPKPKPLPDAVTGIKPKGTSGFLDADQAIAEGYVFISACRNEEQALCPVPGTKVSLLTYHLAEGLAKSGPHSSYRDVYEPLSVALSRFQIPQLEGDAEKRLLAGTAVPTEQYWLVQNASGGVVTLPVGYVQGMTKGSRFAIFPAGTSTRKPENKLAEVEVTSVFTTTCAAKLAAEFANHVPDQQLKAGRAIEVFHNYMEQNLRVWLDGITLPEGWMELNDYLTTEAVIQEEYDVVARHQTKNVDGRAQVVLSDGKPILVLERRDGTELANYPLATHPDKKQLAGLIRDRLLGEWRWVFLTRHLRTESRAGDRIRVGLRLVPVKVEFNADGILSNIVGPREDFQENQSQTQFRTGDYVVAEVCNLSEHEPVYVSILDLGPKGAITPLFPPQDAGPLTEFAPAKLPPDRAWHRIPDLVLRFTPPIGKEVLKVIATLEPADFRPLMYLPPGIEAKGEDDTVPRGSKGLGQLLNHARRGTKDVTLSTVGADWASTEIAFEVVDP